MPTAVPDWVDVRARLLWVDYTVDGSCEVCDDRVFDQKFIPALPSSRPVVFTTGDAFESTGAERIVVHLRSPFLDPQRSRVLQALREEDTRRRLAEARALLEANGETVGGRRQGD